MNGIQLDLFTFAAMQSQEQPIKAEPVIVPKNFINDGKYPSQFQNDWLSFC